MAAEKIKVVVIDDSALIRSLLTEIINRESDMTCIGAAHDPLVAREMIRELNPDVITLDVEMPRMDGLEFLSRLMRLRPMPVVMISTLTQNGAEVTLRSLELGVGPNAIGIMLTGMGADGAKAMRAMKDAGSYNYVQDEASCVVFGMPREAIARGAADEVLPLQQIAPKLIERLRESGADRYRV